MINSNFAVGDVVRVFTKDPTENKIHSTSFEGTVIRFSGRGDSRTFTIRKIAGDKVAVERIFPLNSPIIDKVTLVKSGSVRRAKLYYLRNKRN